MGIVLGRTAETLMVRVIRGSAQSFGIELWDDEAQTIPTDLTGSSVVIELDPSTVGAQSWTATIAGNVATWSFTALQTALSWRSKPAHLIVDGFVLATGQVEVQQ
jgi:hypothetical protein